jgi:hypothetical protein
MSLLVTCWNIQKLNVGKAKDFAFNIAEGLKEPARRVGASNFIGFLLENKVHPDAVGDLLVHHLGGSYSHRSFDVGGGPHTRENIIVVCANSITIIDVGIVSPDLSQLRKMDEQNLAIAKRRAAVFGSPMDLRRPKQVYGNPLVRHPDEWYRGVLVLTVQANGETYRVAALHMPGPDEMFIELWQHAYAPRLWNHADLVVGDFNLPGRIQSDAWTDFSHDFLPSHGTTFDTTSMGFGTSKWDKVLVRNDSKLGISRLECLAPIVPECRAITDHCGLAVFIADAAQPTSRVLTANILPSFAGWGSPIQWVFDKVSVFGDFASSFTQHRRDGWDDDAPDPMDVK